MNIKRAVWIGALAAAVFAGAAPAEEDNLELAIVIGAQGNAALREIRQELGAQHRAPALPQARDVVLERPSPAGTGPATARLAE